MNKKFLKYMVVIAILTAEFSPIKANNNDASFAALGGIVLGALLGTGCTLFFTKRTHEKNVEKINKKHKNEIEDLAIQIIILRARLATKEETQKEQKNNKETNKSSGFFGKLATT